MSTERDIPQATALSDGRVLVAGGKGTGGQALSSAEIYNPANNTWSAAGAMASPRNLAMMALLPNGRVLVAGGHDGIGAQSSAEIFNPTSGTWSAAPAMGAARYAGGIAVLANGRALVVGGTSQSPGAEIFDPASGTWSPTSDMVQIPRFFFEPVRLADGRVVVAGGVGSAGFLDEAEFYDPEIDLWMPLVSMSTSRFLALSAELPDGRILIAGGFGGAGVNNTAETYKLCPPNLRPVALCRNRVVSPTCTTGSVSVDNGSYDPDNGPGPLALSQAPSGPYPLGSYSVTLTASDGVLANTCSAVVTSVPNPPPEITCPAPATLECVNGDGTATVPTPSPYKATITDADATCNTTTSTVVCSAPVAGQRLPVGTTVGTCGTSPLSCNFAVKVVDTQPPAPPTNPKNMVLWPADNQFREVTLMECAQVHYTDACYGAVHIKDNSYITRVTSDEPAGSTVDIQFHWKHTWMALLRAERNGGTADGRVYTIYFRVRDPSGNCAGGPELSCKVRVPRSSGTPAQDSGENYSVPSPYPYAPQQPCP